MSKPTQTPDLTGAFRDRLGRKPSPITMPGYRRGEAPANKGRRRAPEPLTGAEIAAIIAQTSRRGHAGARDRALIVVLWRCGLRISEALNLKIRDVDLDRLFLRVRHGKGDRDRIVGIDPKAADELRSWLERRERITGVGTTGYVFCTISAPGAGGRLGAPQFRSKLKLLAERAGIERDVYPHQFRHTHATELSYEGQPIAVIRDQLGHRYLSTTELYLARIAPTQRLQAIHDRPDFNL